MTQTRRSYRIRGTVQGVGFRPAVYRAAHDAQLGGSIRNDAGSVTLVLVGSAPHLDAFIEQLPATLPPLARIDSIECLSSARITAGDAEQRFDIIPSCSDEAREISIPPDVAMCPACRAEILDPASRRYGYPFTTCTDCGPRYTVLTAMPYDRANTTLSPFPLCPACREEYRTVTDRRFHAETMACPRCGPTLWLEQTEPIERRAPGALQAARAALTHHHLVAVRAVGGYLLAATIQSPEAIARLRRRKARPHRALALMARDLDVVRSVCHVSAAEAALLTSPQAPIVILQPRAESQTRLPIDQISPDTGTLGIMLPTSPLHQLLLSPVTDDPLPPFDFLIMTSGNRCSEPICLTNGEARVRLAGIADAMLMHDREIQLRCDDSLAIVRSNGAQLWRRARGYAPDPLALPAASAHTTLCMGADLKSCISLSFGTRSVLSPHLGDLETPEAVSGLEAAISALTNFVSRTPERVVVDQHPDAISARVGRDRARKLGVPVIGVQHHLAHGMACLAEHGHDQGLALTLDGTGYGPDGTIWGAELLDIRPTGWTRRATFASVPLPGGDAAVRQPIRQVVGRWQAAGLAPGRDALHRLGIGEAQYEAWHRQSERGVNALQTHAAGRLFDTVAALLGLSPREISYEGQAAIRLEAAARRAPATREALPWRAREVNGLLAVDWSPTVAMLTDAAPTPDTVPTIARRFHVAVAQACLAMVEFALDFKSSRRVALSGGVMMNGLLHEQLVEELTTRGLEVCTHHEVPPNDGGIAFGQAAWVAIRDHHETEG